MDAHSKTSVSIFRSLFLIALFSAVAFLLLKASVPSTNAVTQERMFENAIPTNAPIKIQIKKEKEKSFKDLKNGKWAREFELEVINISDKPIYFLYLTLITDVKFSDGPLMFALVYGRPALGDIINKAEPNDIPIKPGETYVFTIHAGQELAWENDVKTKSHPDASRIKAKIEEVSFGDGTGYFLNAPYPKPDKRRSSLEDQMQPSNKAGPETVKSLPRGRRTQLAWRCLSPLPLGEKRE